MRIIKKVEDLLNIIKKIDTTIGFIPTMGALHYGHISLIKRAKLENEFIIVSIFINPKQFLENEDFSKYPRKEKRDIEICIKEGVNILFSPTIESIFNKDEVCISAPKRLAYILEGYSRPKHFEGVLQIIIKLFNIISFHQKEISKAYFGEKDIQQLILIKKMVKDFFIPIKIISCKTIRDKDGLALSSRNIYLNIESRNKALLISKSLFNSLNMINNGEKNVKKIKSYILNYLFLVKIIYVDITDKELNPIKKIIINNTIILISVKIDEVKLIDNLFV